MRSWVLHANSCALPSVFPSSLSVLFPWMLVAIISKVSPVDFYMELKMLPAQSKLAEDKGKKLAGSDGIDSSRKQAERLSN